MLSRVLVQVLATNASPILRCRDLDTVIASLAALFHVDRRRLVRVLPGAANAALADPEGSTAAIVPALAAALGQKPAAPRRIHFFHGTRAFDPQAFFDCGLLPLSRALDEIWDRMRGLAHEIPEADFATFRQGLEDGPIKDLTYRHRRSMGALEEGPHGVLVRDVLVQAAAYGSSTEFLRVPEIIGDICFAASNELKIDLERRFLQATTSCIVEFSVDGRSVDKALAAACWYAEAALRGTTAGGGYVFHNFGGDGMPVPAQDIVCVEPLDVPVL